MSRFYKPIIRGALLTLFTLLGGLVLGLLIGDLVFHLLPGHNLENPSLVHMSIASLPALAGFLVGGAAWGASMGQTAGSSDVRRMALAGLLGFGPITIVLAITMSIVETMSGMGYLSRLPIHRLFTILFVPSSFLIAGTSAWAIGIGLREYRMAWRLFGQVGLTAGFTFFVINLIMESAGWVVGAPGAAQRFTMVTVLTLGLLGTTITAGGMIGWMLTGMFRDELIDRRISILRNKSETG
jgi:hypothetical protein